jgi:hypothetical protein
LGFVVPEKKHNKLFKNFEGTEKSIQTEMMGP